MVGNASTDGPDSKREEPTRIDPGLNDGAAMTPRPARIGHYRIDGVLGVGGFGTVYRGVHRWLSVPGAIKVMRRNLPDRLRGAFLREARRLAGLRGHPAIAEVRDFGFYRDPGTGALSPYFVSDLVPGGRDLLEFARAEGLDPGERLRLFEHVCDGVRHAHAQGVIHLDLKPANVLVWPAAPGRAAQPRIIDFGISRAADPGREAAAHEGLTGTLAYMSPEQTEPGAPLDARSDVYSLGVVLYELLCDAPPYETGRGHSEAIRTIRLAPPDFESAAARRLPITLRAVLQKALSKRPGERHADAGELLEDVRAHRLGRPPSTIGKDPAVRAAYAARRAIARHPIVTKLAILLLAIGAGQWIAVPLLYQWTDATGWFTARFSRPGFDVFQHVVMIERTPATDEKIGFDPAQPRSAFRPHYSTLMKRLEGAMPRAVVFDLMFGSVATGTGGLDAGAASLRKAGIPVIVGVDPHAPIVGRIPSQDYLDPAIRVSISSWGLLDVGGGYPWTIVLARLREGSPALESLVMATMEALWALASDTGAPERLIPDYGFDHTSDRLSLRFFKVGTDAGAGLIPVPIPNPISYRVTGVRLERPDTSGVGSDTDPAADTVALLVVRPPPRHVFDDATIALERFLGDEPDASALRRCRGKIVLIHWPAGEEQHPYHPTESFAGGHVHAAAIETLLRGSILRMPDYWGEWAILAFGGVLGLALPWPYTGRRPWWPGWAVLGTVAAWIVAIAGVVAAAIVAALSFNYVVNPLVVLFGMIVAAGLSLADARLSRFHRPFARGRAG